MPDISKARIEVAVGADLLTWMAVHGNLLLALRHPGNGGAVAAVMRDFVNGLGRMLVDQGILTQAELEFAMNPTQELFGRIQ
jgi:hypothetical protein